MQTVFDVWMIMDRCEHGKPHYPTYRVRESKLGTACSLEDAEWMIVDYIIQERVDNIHSFSVREVPLNCRTGMGSLSEYLYDHQGTRIDQRNFSTVRDDDGVFPGRTPEQIRFKEGDIVEVLYEDEIVLGYVVGLPVSAERASMINSSQRGSHLDDSDDSYTIRFDSTAYHDHVDALRVFKPQFKIHPSVEKRLRNAYNDYVTFPARLEIANTTAVERLKEIFEELEIEGNIYPPKWEEDNFRVTLNLPSGTRDVIIDYEKIYNHMDRVRVTLSRIAGKPVPGRAFRIMEYSNKDIIL